jgi:hypothetical protein
MKLGWASVGVLRDTAKQRRVVRRLFWRVDFGLVHGRVSLVTNVVPFHTYVLAVAERLRIE